MVDDLKLWKEYEEGTFGFVLLKDPNCFIYILDKFI
jgi:hypothetical protein